MSVIYLSCTNLKEAGCSLSMFVVANLTEKLSVFDALLEVLYPGAEILLLVSWSSVLGTGIWPSLHQSISIFRELLQPSHVERAPSEHVHHNLKERCFGIIFTQLKLYAPFHVSLNHFVEVLGDAF